MKKTITRTALMLGALMTLFTNCTNDTNNLETIKNELRAPAYPIIAIDPYTNAWAMTDNLYDDNIRHWTGTEFPLIGAIKVDGVVYRFMGKEDISMSVVCPTSEQGAWEGKYTNDKPKGDWMNPSYNDSSWATGQGAFGTIDSEPTAKTAWDTEYIWVRRIVNINKDLSGKKVFLEYSHDDDVILYINGIEVVNTGNDVAQNVFLELTGDALASLKQGENLIAGYCHNRIGGALIDFGIVTQDELPEMLKNTAIQKSVDVQATQTHYVFACGDVDLKITFTAPLLMDDYELMSRPINYLTYDVISSDDKAHDVSLYFEAGTAWALNKPLQPAESEGFQDGNLLYLKTGSVEQEMLTKGGDDIRIDWGYFYMVAENKNTISAIDNPLKLRESFAKGTEINGNVSKRRSNSDRLVFVSNLGEVKDAQGKLMIGYDDIYSIQYFDENLRPYWNKNGDKNIVSLFHQANDEYKTLVNKSSLFDNQLMNEAIKSGGKKYADMCALAYRQAIAAHKLVEAPNGDLMFLSKENNSNGSIGTVDITYPSAPMFLYYNPELAKALMNHIFYYSESGKWTKPFPSHDIGTYPLANGQTYGDDMPIEESGNILTVVYAVAKTEKNALYAEKHWDVLTVWADYLVANGLDPENQLCTDDFAGHFAHNANLSAKAIMGVASYGNLAKMLGKNEEGDKYIAKAREMAGEWMKMADNGDHYRLTFDQPDTWSQKYNLVWDKLFNMEIFPNSVMEKELTYYLTKQNQYGLPLDNRETYTKTDWIMWTATMTNDSVTFNQFIDPVYDFYNETIHRVPMSDWVYTDSNRLRGFKARSVVGGFYMKMLYDKINEN